MPINSRQKGARAERAWRDELRAHGYTARRGQQFSGGGDSPDVVCEELAKRFWFEIKHVQNLNLRDAMAQAIRDCKGLAPVVAHKKNSAPWLVTMRADDWFDLLREAPVPAEAIASPAVQAFIARFNSMTPGEVRTALEFHEQQKPQTEGESK